VGTHFTVVFALPGYQVLDTGVAGEELVLTL